MPETHPLDNLFWASLFGPHRAIAQGDGDVLRYPADVAPFLGIAQPDVPDIDTRLEALLAPEETVLMLGVVPVRLGPQWNLQAFRPLAQMMCTAPLMAIDTDAVNDIIPLDARHRADVLALTALVYPHYFRARTMDLGRYFGIYRDGRLAAMIGERLAAPGWQEVSAVCTHPDFNGQGLARTLLVHLSNDILARGDLPFLHVSHENARAKMLYERMGYVLRRDIGFWSLQRKG